ncbi:MAG: hypothetical protein ACFB22_11175 [Rhodothalassiaceae bacterium]
MASDEPGLTEEERKQRKAAVFRDWTGALIVAGAGAAALAVLMPYRLSKLLRPEVFVAVFLAFSLFPPDHGGFSLKTTRKAALIAAVAWIAAVLHALTINMFAPRV